MKVWGAALYANRWNGDFLMTVVTFSAPDARAAEAWALNKAREVFPLSHGWDNHRVSVAEVLPALLRDCGYTRT